MQPAVTNQEDQLQRQTRTAAEIAQNFQITTQEVADQAAEHLKGVIDLIDKAEEHHRPTIQSAHETHKRALAALNSIKTPLETAAKILRAKLGEWVTKQQREREAERQRFEAEQRRIQKEEAERLALEAEAQGASDTEIEAVMDQVMMAPAPIVPQAPRAPIVSGFTPRETWSAKVVDLKELCKAIGEGKVSYMLVEPNMTALNQMARAQKQTFNVPGCKAEKNTGIAKGRM
jgi:chromosome segregation ATPase